VRAAWPVGRSRALHVPLNQTPELHPNGLRHVATASSASPPGPSQPAGGGDDARAAMLARIAAAKTYKSGSQTSSPPAAAAAPAAAPASIPPPPSPTQPLPTVPPADLAGPPPLAPPRQLLSDSSGSGADGGFSQSERAPARPDFYSAEFATDANALLGSAPLRKGTGSATEMADWMKGVYSEESGGYNGS
jgi:hypothetical protein